MSLTNIATLWWLLSKQPKISLAKFSIKPNNYNALKAIIWDVVIK